MAFEFFDYDPLTGITESVAFDSDGKFHIRYSQDVEPILEHTKALNAEGLADANWKKYGATTYALIPAVVQGQMLKKGINFLDPNQIGKVLSEINSNYPYLKTTDKVHAIK